MFLVLAIRIPLFVGRLLALRRLVVSAVPVLPRILLLYRRSVALLVVAINVLQDTPMMVNPVCRRKLA